MDSESIQTISNPVVLANNAEISGSCRVCMCSNSIMRPIFEEIQDSISEKISYCTGLQITKEDGLPSTICELCLNELTVAHKFKTTCLTSDEEFHRLLKTKVKKEVIDLHDIFDDNFFEDFPEIDSKCKVEAEEEPAPEKRKGARRKLTEKVPREKKAVKVKKKATVKKEPKPKKVKKEKKDKATLWVAKNKSDCELCNLQFETRKEYITHRKLMHAKSAFVCEICGKVFRHQSSQSLHQLTHREPRYYCNHCDYRTTYRQDLVTHLRTHTGAKLYPCGLCPATFSKSSNKHAHVRRVHEKLTRFTCDQCGRGFYDKAKLQYHLDVHQGVKRQECEICHGLFSHRKHWKRHMMRQHNVVVPPALNLRRKYGPHTAANDSNINKNQNSTGFYK